MIEVTQKALIWLLERLWKNWQGPNLLKWEFINYLSYAQIIFPNSCSWPGVLSKDPTPWLYGRPPHKSNHEFDKLIIQRTCSPVEENLRGQPEDAGRVFTEV